MGLFDWLRPPPALDAKTGALIGHAVATVDPRLKMVGGHERTLAEPVRHAFDYCERVALAIPGPFEISRAAFAADPLVHALFGSADDVEQMLARSQCVRDYLAGHAVVPPGQCCALLGMRRHVTAGFGTRLMGEVIRHDEPQQALSFTDHTLAEPSHDLDGAQQRLAMAMFDGLLKGFVAHVDEVHEERRELLDEQAIARARARSQGPESHTRRLAELQERLRETVDALQPERLLETLTAYLAAPEASLRLDPVKLAVDRLGIIADPDDQHADILRFVELTTRDQRRWVSMIVRIDREEARAAVERFDARARYIVI
ncbi:MAG: hypothetical protein KJ787_11265 [Gammaproteobacteria bacterium]|nr:hypothetical protein [Gammaproteobacteria bacterium]MBU1646900.1 hypothetical protein [Gammaproteobacteria bacterium]MBU1971161.1 hypothetical protein [Gammaproteobacteria bacterium]